jgi:hypothetical protein
MDLATEAAITQLLVETEAAHGPYETSILGGRDADGAGWYALYLLLHGLPDLLPPTTRLDPDRLRALLQQLDADYRQAAPDSDWPSYSAARLSALVA